VSLAGAARTDASRTGCWDGPGDQGGSRRFLVQIPEIRRHGVTPGRRAAARSSFPLILLVRNELLIYPVETVEARPVARRAIVRIATAQLSSAHVDEEEKRMVGQVNCSWMEQ
jgi:hypothetical protein